MTELIEQLIANTFDNPSWQLWLRRLEPSHLTDRQREILSSAHLHMRNEKSIHVAKKIRTLFSIWEYNYE